MTKVYFEFKNDRYDYEAYMRGYRHDVYVQNEKAIYNVYLISFQRFCQNYKNISPERIWIPKKNMLIVDKFDFETISSALTLYAKHDYFECFYLPERDIDLTKHHLVLEIADEK